MSNDTVINSHTNPDLANKLVKQAVELSEQEVMERAVKPTLTLPPATEVDLPGGLFDPFNGLITRVEVRELTGVDEEAVSKIADPAKALLSILERATVKIGDEPATREMIDALFAGDREMILLAIRGVTFGNEIKLGPGLCPHCEVEQIFEIDLSKDIKIKKLEGDSEFTVECKVGKVLVTLPKGSTQKAIVESSNRTSAELDTIMLKNCVIDINGQKVINQEVVRNLGMLDRRTILKEIADRNPGPQLGALKKECQSCGQEVPLPLSLADLFRE
jgi:hypothetical protein